MDLVLLDDYDALSREAAARILETIAAKPDATLLLATGETPMGAYRELAEALARNPRDLSRLRPVQLDEYLDLEADDDRSLWGWMERAVVRPLGVPTGNVIRLAADGEDPEVAIASYEAALRAAGGIDLAVLGLGPNGHLGFNEPPAPADAPTRTVTLTPESVASNARYWGGAERVPRRAVTAGLDIILAARRTLLLVSGEPKRHILQRAVAGPVTPDVPASWLQRIEGVTLLADRAAWGPSAAVGRG